MGVLSEGGRQRAMRSRHPADEHSKRISIVSVDDHEAIRQGFMSIVAEQPDMEIVASIGDPRLIEPTLENTKVDLVLLDIGLPGFNAPKAVGELKAKFPKLKILIASMHDEPTYVLSLVQAGVDGYYLKDESLKTLPKAIREVMAGNGWYSQSVGTIVARNLNNRKTPIELTEREIAVLKGCAAGLTTAQLAESLFVAQRTVQSHLTHIFEKLGAKTRTEAVFIAVQRGIIDAADIRQDDLS
jgi:two-component system NarL family response regulator